MLHIGRSEKGICFGLERKAILNNELIKKDSDCRSQVHTHTIADHLGIITKTLLNA